MPIYPPSRTEQEVLAGNPQNAPGFLSVTKNIKKIYKMQKKHRNYIILTFRIL